MVARNARLERLVGLLHVAVLDGDRLRHVVGLVLARPGADRRHDALATTRLLAEEHAVVVDARLSVRLPDTADRRLNTRVRETDMHIDANVMFDDSELNEQWSR